MRVEVIHVSKNVPRPKGPTWYILDPDNEIDLKRQLFDFSDFNMRTFYWINRGRVLPVVRALPRGYRLHPERILEVSLRWTVGDKRAKSPVCVPGNVWSGSMWELVEKAVKLTGGNPKDVIIKRESDGRTVGRLGQAN